jgi:hypothetical protein
MIRINCPKCQLLLQTADSAAGQVIACPKCGQQMRVAGLPPTAPVAPTDDVPVLSEFEPGQDVPTLEEADERGRESDALPSVSFLKRKADQSLLDTLPEGAPQEALELGKPFARFLGSDQDTLEYLKAGGLLAVFLFIALAVVLGVRGNPWGKIVFGYGLLVLILGALTFLLVIAIKSAATQREVLICPDGLIYILGKKVVVCHWDKVQSVTFAITRIVDQYGNHRRTVHNYWIRMLNGVPVHLNDSLEDIQALGSHVLAETTRRLLARSWEQFNAGQKVLFGAFVLDKQTLSFGGRMARWENVVSFTVVRGKVRARLRNDDEYFAEQPLHDVPNPYVLLAMTDALIREYGEG